MCFSQRELQNRHARVRQRGAADARHVHGLGAGVQEELHGRAVRERRLAPADQPRDRADGAAGQRPCQRHDRGRPTAAVSRPRHQFAGQRVAVVSDQPWPVGRRLAVRHRAVAPATDWPHSFVPSARVQNNNIMFSTPSLVFFRTSADARNSFHENGPRKVRFNSRPAHVNESDYSIKIFLKPYFFHILTNV